MHKDLPENPVPFILPVKGNFGADDSERFIEIPWAISLYGGEPVVLDVGYAHAEERYISALLSLSIPHLHGVDLVEKRIEGIIPHTIDIRKTSFPDHFFDLVFCISTLEHIGRDVSRYTHAATKIRGDGDFEALREIVRITKNQGKIVLTVPYGRGGDNGWLINYDEDRLRRLVQSLPLQVRIEEYFMFSGCWRRCGKQELVDTGYRDNHAPAAAGLACLLLVKTEAPAPETGSGSRSRQESGGTSKETLENPGRSGGGADNRDSDHPAHPAGHIPAGSGTEGEYFPRYLEYLNRSWDIRNDAYRIRSHQSVFSRILVWGRKLVNGEVRRYADPVIVQQIEFNASTVRVLNRLVQRIEDLERQLAEQKKAASQEKPGDPADKK